MNKSNKNKLQTYIAHMEYKVQVYDKGIKDGEAWVKVDVSSKTFIDHLRNFLTHTNTITADIDRLTAENAAWKAEKQSLLHHWGIEMNDVRHQGEQLTAVNEKLKGLLKRCEWSCVLAAGTWGCLFCDTEQTYGDEPYTHKPDCELADVVKIIASPTPEMMGREMAKKLNEKEKG